MARAKSNQIETHVRLEPELHEWLRNWQEQNGLPSLNAAFVFAVNRFRRSEDRTETEQDIKKT